MFVIKNKNGAFVEWDLDDNKKLNYIFTTIEKTRHYTESEINIIHERFKGTWRRQEFKIFKINYNLMAVNWL